jgi:hypothetical protein
LGRLRAETSATSSVHPRAFRSCKVGAGARKAFRASACRAQPPRFWHTLFSARQPCSLRRQPQPAILLGAARGRQAEAQADAGAARQVRRGGVAQAVPAVHLRERGRSRRRRSRPASAMRTEPITSSRPWRSTAAGGAAPPQVAQHRRWWRSTVAGGAAPPLVAQHRRWWRSTAAGGAAPPLIRGGGPLARERERATRPVSAAQRSRCDAPESYT